MLVDSSAEGGCGKIAIVNVERTTSTARSIDQIVGVLAPFPALISDWTPYLVDGDLGYAGDVRIRDEAGEREREVASSVKLDDGVGRQFEPARV